MNLHPLRKVNSRKIKMQYFTISKSDEDEYSRNELECICEEKSVAEAIESLLEAWKHSWFLENSVTDAKLSEIADRYLFVKIFDGVYGTKWLGEFLTNSNFNPKNYSIKE